MINSLFDPVAPRARVRPFVYRDLASPPDAEPNGDSDAPGAAEPLAVRETQARQEGRREAEAALAQQFEHKLQRERSSLEAALAAFAAERRNYFQRLERDVVGLSLAMARKVLRREAQFDPLLLAGSVRVALDQLAANTEVQLQVPPSQLPVWRAWLAQLDTACMPTLQPNPELEPTGCRLVAETGTTDLSLDSQFTEIERGVMELVERRTAVAGEEALPRPEPASVAPPARKAMAAGQR